MRFALITDIHFGPAARFAGKLRKLSHHAEEITRGFVSRMKQEKPDLVVNLGDVVEDESREVDYERYRRFVELLGEAGAPLLHVAGNHDQINLSDDDLRALWGHSGPLHYSRELGDVRFVVLNTLETKDVAVRLPEAQLAWLEAELAAADKPVIVLMHHPASDQDLTGNRWFEKAPHICRVAERKKVRTVIEASGKVLAVFNGHVHWNHFDVIRGIPYVTLQSPIENLDEDAPGRAARAFAICDLDPRRLSIRVEGEETVRYQLDF